MTYLIRSVPDDLLQAAHLLVDYDVITDAGELLYFFEKPWKWQSEVAEAYQSRSSTEETETQVKRYDSEDQEQECPCEICNASVKTYTDEHGRIHHHRIGWESSHSSSDDSGEGDAHARVPAARAGTAEETNMEENHKTTPRVLVGAPMTSHKRYALANYVWTLQHLTYPNRDALVVLDADEDPTLERLLTALGVRVALAPKAQNPRERIANARQVLWDEAIREGYTHVLSLESDVTPPLDVIERLMARQKGYVTTVQWNTFIIANLDEPRLPAKITRFPALSRQSTESGPREGRYYNLTEEELAEGPMIRVDRSHLGCVLIRTSLLQGIVAHDEDGLTEDYVLSDDIRAKGEELWCDTTIPLFHLSDGTTKVRAREWQRKEAKK